MKQNVYVGSNPLRVAPGPIAGARVVRDGEDFYQITDYDRMRPFFLSIKKSAPVTCAR